MYFKDIEEIIRNDFKFIPPTDSFNKKMSFLIVNTFNSVAIHIRFFDPIYLFNSENNINIKYYKNAINLINNKIKNPHFFIFSDNIKAAKLMLESEDLNITYINNNNVEEMAYADLWLMTKCQHFILSNSNI